MASAAIEVRDELLSMPLILKVDLPWVENHRITQKEFGSGIVTAQEYKQQETVSVTRAGGVTRV